jgi:Flp pilus assembly protein TadG
VRDEQGATLVLVALGITAFLGMVALAVDLGMLLGARTESQRVADAAALAGAASFLTDPTNVDRPREWAIEYAALNTVLGQTAVVQDQDVDVLLDEHKVRVRVYNVEARGNSIATIFARALGWQSMDVSTVAAAEAYPATQTKLCPIPIALPDRWLDGNADAVFTGTGNYDPDLYVPFEANTYLEGVTTQIETLSSSGAFTGYYKGNIGDIIEIKTSSNTVNEGEEASPCVETESWRCWFQPFATNGAEMPADIGGVDALIPWIWGCPNGERAPVGIGDWVYESSGGGDKQRLLHQDFVEVMNLEPNLVWNGTCVVDDFDMSGECVEKGYRVRTAPVIDPTSVIGTGSEVHAKVSGLACVFLEQVGVNYVPGSTEITPFKSQKGNWNLYIRMIPCAGMGPSAGDGTIVKALRLVE